eukprot:2760973-Pleurochrysis_carterae.AAC.1
MSCATCAGVQSDIQPRDRHVRAVPAALQPPLGAHVARRGGVRAPEFAAELKAFTQENGLGMTANGRVAVQDLKSLVAEIAHETGRLQQQTLSSSSFPTRTPL